jgi:hypothetical protein
MLMPRLKAFPPANVIFTGIGVLLAVRGLLFLFPDPSNAKFL